MIESITSKRDPQPEFEALYLLMPTTQNVDRIIKDFTNHKQYAAAHLFFTEGTLSSSFGVFAFPWLCKWYRVLIGLSEHLFEKLTASPAEPHLQALKELFINFSGLWLFLPGISTSSWYAPLAMEAHMFLLQEPSHFFSTYSPPRTDAAYKPARARLEEDLRFTSKMVRTLLDSIIGLSYLELSIPR